MPILIWLSFCLVKIIVFLSIFISRLKISNESDIIS